MTLRPIIIKGGGLAGLSLGIKLRQAGIPVTIHEAGDYPRHKVCGEFITGVTEAVLRDLGIDDDFSDALHHCSIDWYENGQAIRRDELKRPAWGISRYKLDLRLAERFTQLGGVLKTCSRITSDSIGSEGLVDATGRRPAAKSAYIGLKRHYQQLPLTADLEIHFGRNCYIGLSGIDSTTVNVCGLFLKDPELPRAGAKSVFHDYLEAAGLSDLLKRLERAEYVHASQCTVAGLTFGYSIREDLPAVRIGDQLGMISPFTGNGMSIAFESALEAANVLSSYAQGQIDWSETLKATEEGQKRHFARRIDFSTMIQPVLLSPPLRKPVLLFARTPLFPFQFMYKLLH